MCYIIYIYIYNPGNPEVHEAYMTWASSQGRQHPPHPPQTLKKTKKRGFVTSCLGAALGSIIAREATIRSGVGSPCAARWSELCTMTSVLWLHGGWTNRRRGPNCFERSHFGRVSRLESLFACGVQNSCNSIFFRCVFSFFFVPVYCFPLRKLRPARSLPWNLANKAMMRLVRVFRPFSNKEFGGGSLVAVEWSCRPSEKDLFLPTGRHSAESEAKQWLDR